MASQNDMNGANSAETDIHPDDIDMMDEHPPSSPSPDPIEPQIQQPQERKFTLAFLCNPSDEDTSLPGNHTSELFSDMLDSVHKRTLDDEYNCEWIFTMSMAQINCRFS